MAIMTVDVITYNGEADLFDLRYNILKDYVDEFIVVEFDKTFSGKDKPWYFEQIRDRYPTVTYCQITSEVYDKYKDLALSSPNTNYGKGAEHWVREFCQKESIKDYLTHLQDDDIVFIGDCDEIWDPRYTYSERYGKLKLLVYSYFLNQLSSEDFWGTLVAPYKWIKDECLNHERSAMHNYLTLESTHGWHFTSMGGDEAVKKKLEDSYTKETYATDEVINNLYDNIASNKDFLGRDFTYKIDESDWPQYLKDNRDKYEHLCK